MAEKIVSEMTYNVSSWTLNPTLSIYMMTLIYKLDLGILKVYPCTKNEVSRSRLSKVNSTNKQTDTCDPTAELRMVMIIKIC